LNAPNYFLAKHLVLVAFDCIKAIFIAIPSQTLSRRVPRIPSVVIRFILVLVVLLSGFANAAPPTAKIWVTWKGAEPDKGASAWYLRHFVRRDIQFREVETGLLDLGEGTPFDVPQAQFRRTHQRAVYEQLQLAYPVEDKAAQKLGYIIHDIEINLWQPKKYSESALIERAAMDFSKSRQDGWIPLSCYIEWFELIYSKLGRDGALEVAPAFPRECGAQTP
jgi:hypothetical protein